MSNLRTYILVVLSMILLFSAVSMIETSPIKQQEHRDCIRNCQLCKNNFADAFKGHLCLETCESEPWIKVECTLFLDIP